jgi:hypothetical protein
MRASTFTLSILFTLFIGCAGSDAIAQAAKYGKVDEAELKMTQYELDTSAAAIVLSDFGYTKFSFGHEMQVTTERHIRIKILKKSGYNWADFNIPFMPEVAIKNA